MANRQPLQRGFLIGILGRCVTLAGGDGAAAESRGAKEGRMRHSTHDVMLAATGLAVALLSGDFGGHAVSAGSQTATEPLSKT